MPGTPLPSVLGKKKTQFNIVCATNQELNMEIKWYQTNSNVMWPGVSSLKFTHCIYVITIVQVFVVRRQSLHGHGAWLCSDDSHYDSDSPWE